MRILHAADLHLDSAFTALTPDKARQRRRESREILNSLADLALREQVQLVLLSGDLFDGGQVYPETIALMKESLSRMNCPVCIAPGNHDPYSPRSPYAQEDWPENVRIFREEHLTAIPFPQLGCIVHGAAFTAPHRYTQVLDDFTAPKDGMMHLLCLHGAVNEPQTVYGLILREQLAHCGCAYAALGHVHQYSGAQMDGSCVWVYPGCTEGRGFDETGDKGAVLTELTDGRVQVRFIPLCRRRYHVLPVDVTGLSPLEALERTLPDTAADDICRVVFAGETGEQGIDLRKLEHALSPRFFSLELRDETKIARDIWHGAGEDSLRGLFLSQLLNRYNSAKDEAEKTRIIAAVRFGLDAMDGRDTD